MAQYDELPVYKATYDLLLEMFRFTKDFIHGWPPRFCGTDRVKILWGGTVPPRRRGGPAASFQLN
jgi:hypothetical protein